MNPKYPKVKVKLSGTDGNAFAVMGKCQEAARAKGVSEDELAAFRKEAMSGDYRNLLATCGRWFSVK